ncbi:MAG TPA: STAS/SEC14 domain-containing protein [Solirubrobacterales bacterium]|nr:STAS/SEC14 domain-containing protein [Solirubrobacterales bacterium]
MIERIDAMPAGTIGARASGKLSKDDYVSVLEPAITEGIDSGELRFVFVVTDFEGVEPSAAVEDMKTGLRAIVRDHAAWRRFALVTDVEWIASAFRLFAWMTPGEVRIFEPGDLEQAKAWVAGA